MTVATPAVASNGPVLPSRIVVGALIALSGALIVWHGAYRSLEIRLSGVFIGLVTSSGVHVAAHRQTVYFGLGTDHAIGLRITPECTSAFLVVPLLLVAALMLGMRPRITRRVLLSLGAAVAVLVLVNQARMLVLVWLISDFGRDRGYYLGHTLFGSMVSVFGGAAALVLFVWLATRGPRAARVPRELTP
ncbi:MAG TPA: exosortase P [Pseudonocardiaceae bacterium]